MRAVGPHDHVIWIALALVLVVWGMKCAMVASRRGEELLGIALVALVGILVSPVSWIHHLVWVVLVLAVIVGDATDRRRVTIAGVAAALFTLRTPYLARSIPAGWHLGWITAVLRDADSIECVALFFVLVALTGSGLRFGRTPSTDRTPRREHRRPRRASRTPAPPR